MGKKLWSHRLAVGILVALSWIPGSVLGSTGSIRIQGDSFPAEVDLRDQFAKWTQPQVGGTCHVFAAAALYEAACYRATGKRVDISQAYMTYRHIRARTRSVMGFFQKYTYDKNRDSWGAIFDGSMDGGFSQTDLGDLLRGEAVSESELPFDYEFTQAMRSVGSMGRKFENAYGMFQGEIRFREYANAKLDGYVLKKFQASHVPVARRNGSENLPFVGYTRDPALKECQSKKMVRKMRVLPTVHSLIQLLASGKPVICSGRYVFDSDSSGQHASTIIGYRYNEKSYKKIEFLLRDSNDSSPEWGWSWGGRAKEKKFYCTDLIWLQ